ncbi:hypothetical protein HKX48_005937 [Thoreauomyces humboldtii]|nr:hypothetical protein HKX48_005937 [Thoreauomyces humboldtii]
MSEPAYARERKAAIECVQRASALCIEVFQNLVTAATIEKKDKSPVTVADYGAQAVVNAMLQRAFPDDPIVGEEDSAELRSQTETVEKVVRLANSVMDEDDQMSETQVLDAIDRGTHAGGSKGRFWTLDPIGEQKRDMLDGTKGFLRGEQTSRLLADVSSCLFDLKAPINAPLSSWDSAESEEHQIHVHSAKLANETTFCESVEAGHSSQGEAGRIAQKLGIQEGSGVRMDSQCKYGVVARGEAGIYLRLPVSESYQEKIWDHAGGSLLVHEAGGKVCDSRGKELDFAAGRTLINNKGVIATNGAVHEEVMAAVAEVLAEKTKL